MSAKIQNLETVNFRAIAKADSATGFDVKAITPASKGLFRLKKMANPTLMQIDGPQSLLDQLGDLEDKVSKLSSI